MSEKNVSHNIYLKDIIRKIQDELIESQVERECLGIAPLFSVDKLEIELNFIVNETNDIKGGFAFPIVTANASKSYNEQQIHKIKLTLNSADDKPASFKRLPGQLPNIRKVDE